MTATAEQVHAGQAAYSPRTLSIYDPWVLGFSNRFVWRCPTSRLLEHYDAHVSDNHLDIGVGTGYYLDRCTFPTDSPRIALMDLNENSLAFAAQRIARYHPETYIRNVLDPIPFQGDPFDSVGINYLLHCLPGNVEAKATVFDRVRPLIHRETVVFGSTLLQSGVPRGFAARRLMSFYQRKGYFDNANDDLDVLERELRARFDNVVIVPTGCVAIFAARGAR